MERHGALVYVLPDFGEMILDIWHDHRKYFDDLFTEKYPQLEESRG
ncbi:hypothetical protein NIES4101_81590 [Calothrix sp. NIES-4101]|nr:hypothetical protein NIES4101_81590 [Calothrix sp. NIES-4101]